MEISTTNMLKHGVATMIEGALQHKMAQKAEERKAAAAEEAAEEREREEAAEEGERKKGKEGKEGSAKGKAKVGKKSQKKKKKSEGKEDDVGDVDIDDLDSELANLKKDDEVLKKDDGGRGGRGASTGGRKGNSNSSMLDGNMLDGKLPLLADGKLDVLALDVEELVSELVPKASIDEVLEMSFEQKKDYEKNFIEKKVKIREELLIHKKKYEDMHKMKKLVNSAQEMSKRFGLGEFTWEDIEPGKKNDEDSVAKGHWLDKLRAGGNTKTGGMNYSRREELDPNVKLSREELDKMEKDFFQTSQSTSGRTGMISSKLSKKEFLLELDLLEINSSVDGFSEPSFDTSDFGSEELEIDSDSNFGSDIDSDYDSDKFLENNDSENNIDSQNSAEKKFLAKINKEMKEKKEKMMKEKRGRKGRYDNLLRGIEKDSVPKDSVPKDTSVPKDSVPKDSDSDSSASLDSLDEFPLALDEEIDGKGRRLIPLTAPEKRLKRRINKRKIKVLRRNNKSKQQSDNLNNNLHSEKLSESKNNNLHTDNLSEKNKVIKSDIIKSDNTVQGTTKLDNTVKPMEGTTKLDNTVKPMEGTLDNTVKPMEGTSTTKQEERNTVKPMEGTTSTKGSTEDLRAETKEELKEELLRASEFVNKRTEEYRAKHKAKREENCRKKKAQKLAEIKAKRRKEYLQKLELREKQREKKRNSLAQSASGSTPKKWTPEGELHSGKPELLETYEEARQRLIEEEKERLIEEEKAKEEKGDDGELAKDLEKDLEKSLEKGKSGRKEVEEKGGKKKKWKRGDPNPWWEENVEVTVPLGETYSVTFTLPFVTGTRLHSTYYILAIIGIYFFLYTPTTTSNISSNISSSNISSQGYSISSTNSSTNSISLLQYFFGGSIVGGDFDEDTWWYVLVIFGVACCYFPYFEDIPMEVLEVEHRRNTRKREREQIREAHAKRKAQLEQEEAEERLLKMEAMQELTKEQEERKNQEGKKPLEQIKEGEEPDEETVVKKGKNLEIAEDGTILTDDVGTTLLESSSLSTTTMSTTTMSTTSTTKERKPFELLEID